MTTKSAPKTAAASRGGRSAASTADGKAAAKSPSRARKTRSAAETERIRAALTERLEELRGEYDSLISELTDLQRDRLTDSAGDDQADTGTKTFEREQEISLANGIRERVVQVERALERLDGGAYGYCERCGNPIPAERLAAFPSATLCVSCKQLEERR
jgi:DnaK suppressor protein